MATTIEFRSTLEDVDHGIAAAEREIGRLRTEQHEQLHQAAWNTAKQHDRQILEWAHWAETLRRYRTQRHTIASPAAHAVDIRPWVARWAVFGREHSEAQRAAEHVDQFTDQDARPVIRAAWQAWLTLAEFSRVAFEVTHDKRFTELPRSPEACPMFETAFLRWRLSETPPPTPDASRWADLLA
jgi:hypothetical protein